MSVLFQAFCRELAIIRVFEENTHSVVNIVDNSLQVRDLPNPLPELYVLDAVS